MTSVRKCLNSFKLEDVAYTLVQDVHVTNSLVISEGGELFWEEWLEG